MRTIIILPDGETWNTLDGCFICTVTDEQFNELCYGNIDVNDINAVSEFGIKEFFTKE